MSSRPATAARPVAAAPALATPRTAPLSPALPAALRNGLAQAQLPALDGVRAVAAFAVVFHHARLAFVPAGLGVLAFFVLSGFLITWLLLREDEATGSVSLRGFYARRSLRIFPAFLCYWLLVMALLLVLGKPIVVGQAVASFLYLNNYYQAISGDPNTLLSHTWSLGVEEQFYLLWPALFLALRDDRARLARVLAAMIVVLWAYRLTMVLAFDIDQGYVYEAFDMRADHLLVGCFLAVALRAGSWPRVWHLLVGAPSRLLVTAAVLVLSAYCAHVFGVRYRDTVGFIVDPLLVAALLVQGIAFRTAWSARWLNWRWMRFLGLISYPVYLYHPLTIGAVDKLHIGSMPAYVAAVVLLTILAARASYYVVERPMLRLKGRFARPVSPAEMPGI